VNDGEKKDPNATIQLDVGDALAQVQLVDDAQAQAAPPPAQGPSARVSRKAPPPLPPSVSDAPPASAPAAMLAPPPGASQASPRRSPGKTAVLFVAIVAVAIAAGLGVGSVLRGKGVTTPAASASAARPAAPPAATPSASAAEQTLAIPEIVMSAPAASGSAAPKTP
jgi:hypothetical protein